MSAAISTPGTAEAAAYIAATGGKNYMVVKVGDQTNPDNNRVGLKDGHLAELIVEADWGHLVEISDHMKKVFAIIEIDDVFKDHIKPFLKGNDLDPEDPEYKPRLKMFNLKKLETALGKPGKEDKWRGPDPASIENGKDKDLSKAVENYKDPKGVEDNNAISSGTYSIGSGKTYATSTLFFADCTTQTGTLNGVVETDVTESAEAQVAHNINSKILNFYGDTSPAGDVTAGWQIDINHTGSGIKNTANSSGTFCMYDLRYKATAAALIAIWFTWGGTANDIYNIYVDGNSQTLQYGLQVNHGNITKMWNVIVWEATNYGWLVPHTNATVYNCAAYNNGNQGFQVNNGGATYKSCWAFGNATDWENTVSATIDNCADSDSTLPVGSGNQRGLTTANEINTTDTNALFGHPKGGATIATNGNTTHHSATDFAGVTWDASDPSIGFIQATASAAVSILPIITNLFTRRRVA